MITPVSGTALTAKASTIQELAESYGKWTGIRTNHVMGKSGDLIGPDGSSRSLSTVDDLELMLALRTQAEVLVVDAKTARQERYAVPKGALILVIASDSGNFDEIPACESYHPRVLKAGPSLAGEQGIKTGSNPWPAILDHFYSNGLSSLLCESGPTLTKMAFESGLVSQSALTVTPAVEDSAVRASIHPFDGVANLQSLAQSPEATFTFWRH